MNLFLISVLCLYTNVVVVTVNTYRQCKVGYEYTGNNCQVQPDTLKHNKATLITNDTHKLMYTYYTIIHACRQCTYTR